MSNFKTTLNKQLMNKHVYGANGMIAKIKTGNKCLDFYYAMGALRGKPHKVVSLFEDAFEENPIVAMKLAFLLRDAREGTGERYAFREITKTLEGKHCDYLIKILHLIPKYGRWDDLEIFTNLEVRKKVFKLIAKGLRDKNQSGLCAKWISRNDNGDKFISGLRSYLKLSPKDFRKKLVNLSDTLEQKMSTNLWSSIDYNQLPSQAMLKHTCAFKKHDSLRFDNYIQDLSSGKSKVNAKTLYPYQIINKGSVFSKDSWLLKDAQWNALPNFFKDSNNESSILPMIDVSGSMIRPAGKTKITCMDVAVSLGMYVSQKQKGSFKNTYLTFDSSPELNIFSHASLKDNALSVYKANWGGSTNLELALKTVLNFAKKNKINNQDMPKILMVLSDMNFNQHSGGINLSALSMIKKMFKEANYVCPTIVFWNLNHNVTFIANESEENILMLSGFSASLIQDIIKSMNKNELNPMSLMLNSLERYNDVEDALK